MNGPYQVGIANNPQPTDDKCESLSIALAAANKLHRSFRRMDEVVAVWDANDTVIYLLFQSVIYRPA